MIPPRLVKIGGDGDDDSSGAPEPVTVSSPSDTSERYADGWRVLEAGADEVLGTHMLAHDHADEQPFTRMQTDPKIPIGVEQVTIEGHDRDNAYGGETVTIDVPR